VGAVAQHALSQLGIEGLELPVAAVRAKHGLHRATRISFSELDDSPELLVLRLGALKQGHERRLVHDRGERDNRGVLGALDQPPEADDAPVTLVFLAQ
jgi:hypothetical protein